MSEPVTILLREEFYREFEGRLHILAPNATFLTFRDREEMLAKLPEAEGFYGASARDDILDKCVRLRWLHMSSAGVDGQLPEDLASRGIVLTKGSGAYNTPISEHILAMMLGFARNLPRFIRNQARRSWDRSGNLLQLADKTLSIYGMGSIGTELARIACALRMKVYGMALKPRPKPNFVEALWTPERLDDLLRVADFLAICCPLTEATRNRFGAREFALMKPTAYVFNIGRGGSIAQDALIEALREGRLAGAGLDVTWPEPLPTDSPLWDMPNVIITPHVAGSSDGTERRANEIVLENIRRFATGEALMNVVDYEHGY